MSIAKKNVQIRIFAIMTCFRKIYSFPGTFTRLPRRFFLWFASMTVTQVTFDLLWSDSASDYSAFTFLVWPFATLAIGWIAALPAAFTKKRWIMTVWALAYILFLYANLLFFREFRSAIPVGNYILVFQAASEASSVVQLMRPVDIVLLFPLIAAVFVNNCLRPDTIPTFRDRRRRALCAVLISAALLLAGSMTFLKSGGFKAYMDSEYDNFYSGFVPVLPAVYSPLASVAYDLMSGSSLSDADRMSVKNWIDIHSSTVSAGNVGKRDMPRNVVMINCESLESWPINRYVEGQPITPFLNRMVADSAVLYLPKVVSQVGFGRSSDSYLMYMTGLMPLRRGDVYSNRYCRGNTFYPSIPKAIASKGAESLIITNDTRKLWNLDQSATVFGFDSILDIDDIITDGSRSDDGEFFRRVISKIDDGEIWKPDKKNFTFLLTRTGHSPFTARPVDLLDLRQRYTAPIDDYMQTTAFVDSVLGEFVDAILRRDPDAMVVITGDHEALDAFRPAILSDSVFPFVGERGTVPLIVINGGVSGVIEYPVGQIDIYPTLLDLLGIDDYNWRGLGFSVFDPAHPHAAVLPDNTFVADTLEVDVAARLREANRVGELIIRHNLLDQ